jgi:release factor glutamine methyltransferase
MNNSIAKQLQWARTYLATESAQLDAEVLLAHIIKKDRSYLYAWPEKIINDECVQQFHKMIIERQQGKPVAYLTGQQEFWSLSLKVTPATLIPRPETEQLIDAVLQCFTQSDKLDVLDLGTGSGAIAIALAKEKPSWHICASDYSFDALLVAQENAKHYQTRIDFFCSDWLAAFSAETFDVIVSNPPYIAPEDAHLNELRYEPQTALVAANKGLLDIESIIFQSLVILRRSGLLYVEHGYNQGASVRHLFIENGFSNVETVIDYAGCERFTFGVKSQYE